MLDLFDAPFLPGLATRANLITANEERMLIERIDATDLEPFRFQGRGRRPMKIIHYLPALFSLMMVPAFARSMPAPAPPVAGTEPIDSNTQKSEVENRETNYPSNVGAVNEGALYVGPLKSVGTDTVGRLKPGADHVGGLQDGADHEGFGTLVVISL